MKKLGLDKVEEFKEFKSPSAGGYVCGIIKVEDVPDKEYLKVYYDIIEGEFKGYFTKLVKEVEKIKDLPFFFASYKESAIKFFKGTITAVEKSNAGFVWKDNEKDLVKKKIGLVLFEEEYVKSDGSTGKSLRVDKAHSIEAIKTGDFEVPEKKVLAQSNIPDPFANTQTASADSFFDSPTDTATNTSMGFMDIPEDAEEDLPFSFD